MAKAKQYQFKTQPVTVVTPKATTLFMCLAEVNEYTGDFGGKLVFNDEALETNVKYKVGKGKETTAPFQTIVDNLIDEALSEYQATSKKARRADKLQANKDIDGEETGKLELSCKNQKQPRIINADKTVEKDFETLIGNGSTVKAKLYLKPYVMQGKVGVTAYLNSIQLLDIIEYGNNDDMFDDEDFESSDVPFDTEEDEGDF